jgi:2-iminobutanoate/2-iminopropanoate deaminase
VRRTISWIAVVVLASGCAHASAPPPEFSPAPAPAPFAKAVRVGRMIYLSGQIGNDTLTQAIVPGGIKPETDMALKRIRSVLQSYGASLDDVVKCTVMLADIREWAAMNEVYVTYFPKHLPARSAFATAGLVMGARVELECIAAQ